MTGREVMNVLQKLTDEQLDNFDIAVSEGCDENGNAEFFSLYEMVTVGDGIVDSAADGVLEEGSPVFLF